MDTSSYSRDTSKQPDGSKGNKVIPAEDGQATNRNRPEDKDFIDPDLLAECGDACSPDPSFISDWQRMNDIASLTQKKEKVLEMADKIDKKAYDIDLEGDYLLAKSHKPEVKTRLHDGRVVRGMDCTGSHSCKRARKKMGVQALKVIEQARLLKEKATNLREVAVAIQAKIDSLSAGG
jgi:hypothetical protein